MYSSTDNLSNWLAMHNTTGIGPIKFQEYLVADPQLKDLPQQLQPNWQAVDRDLEWLQRHSNAAIITLNDPNYPERLKQIHGAPPILFVRGDYRCLAKTQLAIVGSRNPTTSGLQYAKKFAAELVRYGVVITSGMALGIDGASHEGALDAGGETVAVLGCGIDLFYPVKHQRLAHKIMDNGCIVSEFPIGTQPQPGNFPRRNRIISGLSEGVLVVEAALQSGSLITAKYALEQNREVFAIPGSIHHRTAKGCHYLIRQGAKLVETVNDVLEETEKLKALLLRPIHGRNATTALSSKQRLLLQAITSEVACVDLIVMRVGLGTSEVSAILLELELQGLITAVPGGYVRRND